MINYKKYILAMRVFISIMIILSIFGAYGTSQAVKQSNEAMKMYECDAYGYDQGNAPLFCK